MFNSYPKKKRKMGLIDSVIIKDLLIECLLIEN